MSFGTAEDRNLDELEAEVRGAKAAAASRQGRRSLFSRGESCWFDESVPTYSRRRAVTRRGPLRRALRRLVAGPFAWGR